MDGCTNDPTQCYNQAVKRATQGDNAMIDINSISSILSDGWTIYYAKPSFLADFNKDLKSVSISGDAGVGKTWVVRQYTGNPQAEEHIGLQLHKKDSVVFLDGSGAGNAVKNKKEHIVDRRLVNSYIDNVIKEVCDKNIYVVNSMTNYV